MGYRSNFDSLETGTLVLSDMDFICGRWVLDVCLGYMHLPQLLFFIFWGPDRKFHTHECLLCKWAEVDGIAVVIESEICLPEVEEQVRGSNPRFT